MIARIITDARRLFSLIYLSNKTRNGSASISVRKKLTLGVDDNPIQTRAVEIT